MNDLPVLINL